jgi:hypothetical protein
MTGSFASGAAQRECDGDTGKNGPLAEQGATLTHV